MRHSKEKIRAHGQILVDFANANNTDEACYGYFRNIQSFLDFSPKFDTQIKKNFPWMRSFTETMTEPEKNLLELIINEKSKVRSLNSQFEMLGYIFEGCDPQDRKLLLSTYHQEGGLAGGEPDFSTTIDGPYPYSFEELRDDIEGSLHPDVPKHINDLMKIGQSIHGLKSKIQNNRFEEIYGISKQYMKILDLHGRIKEIQKDYRIILKMIIEGVPLDEISPLARKFKTIYDVSMMTTTKISKEKDIFEEISLIDETSYIRNKISRGWFIEFQNEFVYWMVEFFRGRHNRKYIKKCPYCGNFFIAKDIKRKTRCYSKECDKEYQRKKKQKQREEDPATYF